VPLASKPLDTQAMITPPKKRAFATQDLFQNEWHVFLIAALTTILVFASGIFIDVVLGVENRTVLFSDVFTSAVAGFLAYLAGRYYMRGRQAAREQLKTAAEVNHHVRNALTAVLYSVHARQDAELLDITQQAVDRIDWVLRAELWQTDEDPKLAVETPSSQRNQPKRSA